MKRLRTEDPLTYDDVAGRLDKAALRVLRILSDTRQTEGDLCDRVKTSRYLAGGILEALAAELEDWGVEPRRMRGMRGEDPPPPVEDPVRYPRLDYTHSQ